MIYIGITTSLVSGTRSCSPPSSATDARDQNAHGRTGYCKNVYAALLARVRGAPYSSTEVLRTGRLPASECDREVIGPRRVVSG
jgi:hypothetical protein